MHNAQNIHKDTLVRVSLPGAFNPNVPGNREPDTYVYGVVVGRTPGVPVTYTVKTEAGRFICVADANVRPAKSN